MLTEVFKIGHAPALEIPFLNLEQAVLFTHYSQAFINKYPHNDKIIS